MRARCTNGGGGGREVGDIDHPMGKRDKKTGKQCATHHGELVAHYSMHHAPRWFSALVPCSDSHCTEKQHKEPNHTHARRAAVPSTASLARVAMPEYATYTPPPAALLLDVSWLPSKRQSRISTVLSLASEAEPKMTRSPPPWASPPVLVATLLVKLQPMVVEGGSRGYHKCAPEHKMDGGGVGGGVEG